MKILVLGSTGMLGYSVGKYFINKYGEDNVYLSYRKKELSYGSKSFYFNAMDCDFDFIYCDYVINCIGIIKQNTKWDSYEAIKINSCFPIELSRYCKKNNMKLIQITTDCVFSGKEGGYVEESIHDALDEYGKSKSLGEECKKKSMVIRTSVIGEEIHNNVSLVSWVKSQHGKNINGYINHFWNGVTCLQYAKICEQIIENKLYKDGLYHVFSNSVNKYDLVSMINDHFKLNITVNPFRTETLCDRTLSTTKELNSKLDIPLIEKQIKEM